MTWVSAAVVVPVSPVLCAAATSVTLLVRKRIDTRSPSAVTMLSENFSFVTA